MRSVRIMTVCGDGEPGIIESLTVALTQLGSEVVARKVMSLEGQVAVLMKLVEPEIQKNNFQKELARLFPLLRFAFSAPCQNDGRNRETHEISLSVSCLNRQTIQHELADIFNGLDFQVESMKTDRLPVAGIGETAFKGRYTLKVPAHLSSDEVADDIERLMDGVRVAVLSEPVSH